MLALGNQEDFFILTLFFPLLRLVHLISDKLNMCNNFYHKYS